MYSRLYELAVFRIAARGEGSAAFRSVTEAYKASGIGPYSYLRLFFERLPNAHTAETYKALLLQYLTEDSLPQNANPSGS